jgi:hypothetical protein
LISPQRQREHGDVFLVQISCSSITEGKGFLPIAVSRWAKKNILCVLCVLCVSVVKKYRWDK